MSPPNKLIGELRTKAAMIELGESIQWGSEVALMREAADALEQQHKHSETALGIKTYVTETAPKGKAFIANENVLRKIAEGKQLTDADIASMVLVNNIELFLADDIETKQPVAIDATICGSCGQLKPQKETDWKSGEVRTKTSGDT